MKLLYSTSSPYARKVRLLMGHIGVSDQVELCPITVSPLAPENALSAANPLAKIPTLILDDGQVLYDSRVMVEYLDNISGGAILPASGPERWAALTTMVLADGVVDAAALIRYETALRPAHLVWADWVKAQRGKIHRGLAALDALVQAEARPIPVVEYAIISALGYLDLRFPDLGWREDCKALRTFMTERDQRPDIFATAPPTT